MFKHILVPTDGSPLSDIATTKAVEFARSIGAALTFLHVLPDLEQGFGGYEGIPIDRAPPPELVAERTRQANALLAKPEMAARQAGLSCEAVVASGPSPFEAIIETAATRGCDLILMASHGHRGVKGLVLGSETHKVLTHSKIPVLVYR